jgi:hypothetical protein
MYIPRYERQSDKQGMPSYLMRSITLDNKVPEELKGLLIEIRSRFHDIVSKLKLECNFKFLLLAKLYGKNLEWFYLPNVGRYNNFELKFEKDWNWLISAVIEMQKYQHTFEPRYFKTYNHKLAVIFNEISKIQLYNLNLMQLWVLVSDFALELQLQKQIENAKRKSQPNNNQSNGTTEQ